MYPSSHVLYHVRRVFHALACVLAVAATFALAGCKLNLHDEVYTLANAKSRTIAAATISPGDGTEYAFTVDKQPSIEITCPVTGTEAFYSIDGGDYRRYEGPFTLPIADPKVDQTFTVSAYVSHPDYLPSEPVSQTYRFVATTVPAPTISVTPSSPAIETALTGIYRFDKPPVIALSCPLASAEIWYSLDGGATYSRYSAPFTLPVTPDWESSETVTVLAYASYASCLDSAKTSRDIDFYGYGTIVTIAGQGTVSGFSDGDGSATTAEMTKTFGIYVDAAGSVYVADFGNHCVRKITIDGRISTFAGIPTVSGYDNECPATSARLWGPTGLAADETGGVLYISDMLNYCVRKVPLAGGVIATIAGTPPDSGVSYDGTPCASAPFGIIYGLFFDPTDRFLYIADNGAYAIWKVYNDGSMDRISRFAGLGGGGYGDGGDNQLAIETALLEPYGIARFGSSFLVADHAAKKIRAIDMATGNTTTFIMASGKPFGMHAVGTTLYYADDGSNQVFEVDELGSVTVVAGNGIQGFAGDGGPATSAELNRPSFVFAVPGDGVYFSDRDNYCVRKVIRY